MPTERLPLSAIECIVLLNTRQAGRCPSDIGFGRKRERRRCRSRSFITSLFRWRRAPDHRESSNIDGRDGLGSDFGAHQPIDAKCLEPPTAAGSPPCRTHQGKVSDPLLSLVLKHSPGLAAYNRVGKIAFRNGKHKGPPACVPAALLEIRAGSSDNAVLLPLTLEAVRDG